MENINVEDPELNITDDFIHPSKKKKTFSLNALYGLYFIRDNTLGLLFLVTVALLMEMSNEYIIRFKFIRNLSRFNKYCLFFFV